MRWEELQPSISPVSGTAVALETPVKALKRMGFFETGGQRILLYSSSRAVRAAHVAMRKLGLPPTSSLVGSLSGLPFRRRTLSLVVAQTKTRNVQLVRELGSGLPEIYASRIQIQQIIINLANNAIDAMPEGGTLTITTARSAGYPGRLEIIISDTGGGIPAHLKTKVFEPFFTTKEVGKGTGLGLPLVYEIVNKHGGTVELESQIGKGTKFTVVLPRNI